jgi:hypothetical protein
LAYGELMSASMPPVVANVGRNAAQMAVSGFALPSSVDQKADSSPIAPTSVKPRTRLKLDARTCTSRPFVNRSCFCVRFLMSW